MQLLMEIMLQYAGQLWSMCTPALVVQGQLLCSWEIPRLLLVVVRSTRETKTTFSINTTTHLYMCVIYALKHGWLRLMSYHSTSTSHDCVYHHCHTFCNNCTWVLEYCNNSYSLQYFSYMHYTLSIQSRLGLLKYNCTAAQEKTSCLGMTYIHSRIPSAFYVFDSRICHTRSAISDKPATYSGLESRSYATTGTCSTTKAKGIELLEYVYELPFVA